MEICLLHRFIVSFVVLLGLTNNNNNNGYGTVRADCQFPSDWHGSWYQSGLGEIIISAGYITHKGSCYEHHRDYFLVENRQDNCRQCLLMMTRHTNLLQYKEKPSQPVACPFQTAAFHFVYNNNSGGFCRQPTSYVHRCAAESKFHFSFRRCLGCAYTYDKDLELECLANWKDGSDMFFYGVFSAEGLVTKEETYRCFMYKVLGNVVFLSMSADATCRGLRTPQDGPLIMELTEDPAVASSYWPGSSCQFPGWMTAVGPNGWRDLSGKHRYMIRNNDSALMYAARRPSATASTALIPAIGGGSGSQTSVITHLLASYQCVRQFHDVVNETEPSGRTVVVLAHVRDDCLTRIQCLRLQQRDFHIVQLQKGSFTDAGRCTADSFASLQSNLLLVSADLPTSRSCPFSGRYRSAADATGCKLEVIAGCSDKSQLDVISSCQTRPVLQLKCVTWWRENHKFLLLAHESHKDESGRLLCYSIQEHDDTVEISNYRSCSQESTQHNFTAGNHHPVDVYTFHNYLDECPQLEPDQAQQQSHMTVVRTVDDNDDDKLPAGAYSHVIGDEPSRTANKERSVKVSVSEASCSTHFSSCIIGLVLTLTTYLCRLTAGRFELLSTLT